MVDNILLSKLFYHSPRRTPHYRKLPERYNIGYDQFSWLTSSSNKDHASKKVKLSIFPTKSTAQSRTCQHCVNQHRRKRLYYYHLARATLYIYPAGIGRSHTPTLWATHVIHKRYKPIWNVTADGLKEARESGNIDHPRRVMPGPDNLGNYAIHLSKPNYLIHSTNDPEKIGTQNTAGCVNLYPEHMAELYPLLNLKPRLKLLINQSKP